MVDPEQNEIPWGSYMFFDLPVGEYLVIIDDDGGAEFMSKLNMRATQVGDAATKLNDTIDPFVADKVSDKAAIGYGPTKNDAQVDAFLDLKERVSGRYRIQRREFTEFPNRQGEKRWRCFLFIEFLPSFVP